MTTTWAKECERTRQQHKQNVRMLQDRIATSAFAGVVRFGLCMECYTLHRSLFCRVSFRFERIFRFLNASTVEVLHMCRLPRFVCALFSLDVRLKLPKSRWFLHLTFTCKSKHTRFHLNRSITFNFFFVFVFNGTIVLRLFIMFIWMWTLKLWKISLVQA